MIQCRDCEYYREGSGGAPRLLCDPFGTIKEPECLVKWQIIKLEALVRSHQATLEMYERLAPLQERMIRHMERELDEADDADSWKYGDAAVEDDDDDLFSDEDPSDRDPPRP